MDGRQPKLGNVKLFFLAANVGIVVTALGCSNDSNNEKIAKIQLTPQSAIKRVLEMDKQFGAKRNQASRTTSLSDAVDDYLAAVKGIDMSECPDDFRVAFEKHMAAWKNSKLFFDKYANYRGEMHNLFNTIRAVDENAKAGIEEVERELFGTWNEVEQALLNHQ